MSLVVEVQRAPIHAAVILMLALLWTHVSSAQEGTADAVAQRFQCGAANEAQQQATDSGSFASVTVVFRDDRVGCRQVQGVLDACEAFGDCNEHITIRFAGYRAESQGVSQIQAAVDNMTEITDVILGPSDSGVFVRSAELLKWPGDRRVPIISPIVTAAFGSAGTTAVRPVNSHTAWFFSTNVNAQHRTDVMVRLLNRKSIQAVSVLYSDSEFSRQIEAAVRDKFDLGDSKKYAAYRFANVSAASRPLDEIMDERPGAIGIIGLRSQIDTIVGAFHTRNDSWNTYRPLLFTAIDAGDLEMPNLYYPILEQAAALDLDEVYALSYDTMTMVARIVVQQSRQGGGTFSHVAFQGEFASLLDGQARQGSHSGMRFDDFQNVASLQMHSSESELAVPLGEPMSAFQAITSKFEARYNRFGQLMLINIGIVVVVVLALSAIDIQRSYFGNKRSIWLTWPFLVLVAFNIASALVVYSWLAESQQIRWDSTVYALAVALGFSALLKSTLFQTETGKRIGVQAVYEQFVEWLNSCIMVAKHERSAAIINYLAYRNTLDFLETRLRSVYAFAESPETQRALMEELDTQIKKVVPDGDGNVLIRKRIVCATKLMKLMSWKKLRQNRIVPYHIRRWEIVNPEQLVDISASLLLDNDENAVVSLRAKVDELINEDAKVNPERAQRQRDELKLALKEAGSPNSDVYIYVRYLFVHFRGKASKLLDEGLLPENWLEFVPKLALWRRLLGMSRGGGKTISERSGGEPAPSRILRLKGNWSGPASIPGFNQRQQQEPTEETPS